MFARISTQVTRSFILPTFQMQKCAFSRMTGCVKTFDNRKGFGFIMPHDGSPDVFVHQTQIKRPGFRYLIAGEEVEFDVQESERGRHANNVSGPDGEELPDERGDMSKPSS